MATVSIKEITDGIKSKVETAVTESGGVIIGQSEDEMTEGANLVGYGTALAQIYWSGFSKSPGGGTHHITFGSDDDKPIYETQHRFFIDVLAMQRHELSLDLTAVAETAVAVDEILEAEVSEPLFDVTGIKAFNYEADFVMFRLGQEPDSMLMAGERFTLTVELF